MLLCMDFLQVRRHLCCDPEAYHIYGTNEIKQEYIRMYIEIPLDKLYVSGYQEEFDFIFCVILEDSCIEFNIGNEFILFFVVVI